MLAQPTAKKPQKQEPRMPIRLRQFAILLPVAMVAAGCGKFDKSDFADGRAGIATPRSFMNKSYEEVDIIAALTDGAAKTEITDKTTDVEASTALQAAYTKFYQLGSERLKGAERRNQIQDELFRASDQRCNYYKAYLYHLQSTQRGFLGSLSTALGGLGAIFTSASTARALSGAAGITSGVSAELMEAQYASLTIQVLTEGIEKQRKDVYEAARSQRFVADPLTKTSRLASLSEYTVEHAILDAVRYHGACTITEGLRAAASSIQTIRHPGPEMMRYAVEQSRKLRDQLDGTPATENWSLGYGGFGGGSGVGGLLSGATSSGIEVVPNVALASRAMALDQRMKDLETRVGKLWVQADKPTLNPTGIKTSDKLKSPYSAEGAIAALRDLAEAKFKDIRREDPKKIPANAGDKRNAADFAAALQAKNIQYLNESGSQRQVEGAELQLLFQIFMREIGEPFQNEERKIDATLNEVASKVSVATKLAGEKNFSAVKPLLEEIVKAVDSYLTPPPTADKVAGAVPVVPVARAQAPPPPSAP
jgi:hypothetical protein